MQEWHGDIPKNPLSGWAIGVARFAVLGLVLFPCALV